MDVAYKLQLIEDARWMNGEVIGERFVIESYAGAGGMGAVYRAHDRLRDAPVALKLLTLERLDSRFEREAKLLAELEHPAIVGYVAHGCTDDGRRWLAMDWLEGKDLSAHLESVGKLSLAEVWTVGRRIAAALGVAHARGVVHRDIKPGNLFVVGGDVAKLKVLDFGIARGTRVDPLESTVLHTNTGAVVGTVGYMAPEQARGSADVDARADVFALGCVLFECATGRPAFVGPNVVAVLAKLLLEDTPRARHFEPSLPPGLDELIAQMMSKDPADRPRDAAAVLRAIEGSDDSGSPRSSSGVGDREQRIVTIVLVRGAEGAVDGAIRLADGASLMEFHGEEPVTRAAVWALSLARQSPAASIAIATGRVADDGAGGYGPIIDRVSTLSSKHPGIVIDDASAALLGDRFLVSNGRLVGPTPGGIAPRTLLGKRTPFVGRDKEIALLRATLDECVSEPVARAVVVTGPAGSGKSRLAYELVSQIESDVSVFVARADPVGAGSTLGIARQLVRAAAGLTEADPVSKQHEALVAYLDRFFSGDSLQKTSENLGELVGAPSPHPSVELKTARANARLLATSISRSFGEWISAVVDAGPVALVIEDLHWGDGASVAYLDEALRTNAARPLFLLALARSEVHDLFPSLFQRASAQEVKLSQLTRRAAERLVKSVLSGVAEQQLGKVIENAAGNAFHLEELIRHVAERGDDSLPETVLAIAEARLARLDPEARRLLRIAAVFGETFWTPGVAALLGDDSRAEEALARLVDAEVVLAVSGRRFEGEHRFRHGLLRDAAHAMLAENDRSALHLAAGNWLETHGEQDPLVLAEHFERAGQGRRAAPCYFRAAQQAVDSWNMAVAEVLAERAERAGAEGEILGGLELVRASIAYARGDHANTVRRAKAAYELLPARASASYLAASFVLTSGAYVGDVELAPRIIQELLTTAPDGPPTAYYGSAVRVAADILDSIGQGAAAEHLLDGAEALAGRTEDADLGFQAAITYARTAANFRRDVDIGRVLEFALRGKAFAERSSEVWHISLFKFGEGLIMAELGEIAAARRLFEAAMREIGDAPLFQAWLSIDLAWCDVVDGHYERAVAHARRAYEADPHHAYAVAAFACLRNGEPSEAARLSARSLNGIDDKLVTPFVVAMARAIAARIALAAGRTEEAGRHAALATSIGSPFHRSFVDRTHLEIAIASDRDTRELVERAAGRIERHTRSLDEARRLAYLANEDNTRILELAQR